MSPVDPTAVAQAVAFVAPLLPGTTTADRAAMAACWTGDRRADHEVSRRRAGITRDSTWLQGHRSATSP